MRNASSKGVSHRLKKLFGVKYQAGEQVRRYVVSKDRKVEYRDEKLAQLQ